MKREPLRFQKDKYRNFPVHNLKKINRHQNATTSRVKEAAFQIIRNHIDFENDWLFYDLFAGSGQMGLEALSLGAVHATFVELAQERLNDIQRNLIHLDIPKDNYTLVRTRAAKVLQEAFEEILPCVVWADPPYTYNNTPSNDPANLLMLYREARTSHPRMPLLIIQAHEKNAVLSDEYLAQHSDVKVYRYGSNCLLVIEK